MPSKHPSIIRRRTILLLPLLSIAPILIAQQQDGPWSQKEVSAWTQEDAQNTLNESPWARPTTPTVDQPSNNRQGGSRRMGGGMGGGIGGIGMGRGGMGGGGRRRDPNSDDSSNRGRRPPTLTVRWETAAPIQQAHQKVGDAIGPAINEGNYRIAVANIPRRLLPGSVADLEKQLKSKGELKREGKKTVKSISARVFEQQDGMLVLFDFPRTAEITPNDHQVEFATKMKTMKIDQQFQLDTMLYHGKLEL